MMATTEMDIDLLERCRAHDPEALRGLVALWGDAVLRTALEFTGDRARAEAAARVAFLECFHALPATHSECAFRPWLMGMIAKAALGTETAVDGEVLAGRFSDRARAAALPQTFFDDALARALPERVDIEMSRMTKAPAETVWAIAAEPDEFGHWTGARRFRMKGIRSTVPGARAVARGTVASGIDEEIVFTRVEEERLLAWTARMRFRLMPGTIELRWSVGLTPAKDGCAIRYRLHGAAFPDGLAGRIVRSRYRRLEQALRPSMHDGIERLAALAEDRAR